ncbi:MAG: HIRAN domain-containing protein [Alistipes sp.]|nr:HIRAN domain-containing protein [Alistipes sp.]
MARKVTTNRHFINFSIAGFSYWEGCLVLGELKPGAKLELVYEEENKYDPCAVAIYYGDYKLGFVPRSQNQLLSKFLELGYDDLFDARVQRVSPEEHPEQQVGVIIFINNNNHNF